MTKLTDKPYWDTFHEEVLVPEAPRPPRERRSMARKILGRRLHSYRLSYHHHQLFGVLLPSLLPKKPGLKIVELGSAPGRFLVDFRNAFGYDPYGIEYSDVGVKNNRAVFEQNGIDPDHVIQGDVLDPELVERHRSAFDIVMSMSFIEHFDDVDLVLRHHVEMTKPGGYLVIIAPNLSGLNQKLYGYFNPDDLAAHNLGITSPGAFATLFDDLPAETLYCAPYGRFSFQLFKPVPGAPRTRLLKAGKVAQQGLNIMYRVAKGENSRGSDGTCPFMLYVGRKHD